MYIHVLVVANLSRLFLWFWVIFGNFYTRTFQIFVCCCLVHTSHVHVVLRNCAQGGGTDELPPPPQCSPDSNNKCVLPLQKEKVGGALECDMCKLVVNKIEGLVETKSTEVLS